jgi:hypothetical protein
VSLRDAIAREVDGDLIYLRGLHPDDALSVANEVLAMPEMEDDPAGGTALFFRETVPRNIVRGRFKGAVEYVEVKLWFTDAHSAAAWLRAGLEAAERASRAGDMGYRHLRATWTAAEQAEAAERGES